MTGGKDAYRWRAVTTKAPYLAVDTPPAELPDGFVPVGVELVCRHGSRTVASLRTAQRARAILAVADRRSTLTATGGRAAEAIDQLLATTESLGAGRLTERGRSELRGIAERMARRLPSLFASVEHTDIEVRSASKERTRESADAFVGALLAGSDRQAPEIIADDELLYFHKSDARYRQYLAEDRRLADVLAAARRRPETRRAARTLLGALVDASLVDELAAGRHPGLGADEVDAATTIYAIWQVAGATTPPGEPTALDDCLPLEPLQWFGYLDDLETFYEKGPAFAGDDVTSAMAGVLVADLIAGARAHLGEGRSAMARLLFTHAEEVLPLATLFGIPGADRPIAPDETFTYDTNPFRSADLVPMAANVQWEIFSDGTAALVRMLFNERPTRIGTALRPVGPNRDLYALDEIERHYAGRTSGA